MIINKIVPWQELGNITLIQKYRLDKICARPSELIKTCNEPLADYPNYQKHLSKLAKPESAEAIAKFLDSTKA